MDLFQFSLGLKSPWYVARTEFDTEVKRRDLYLGFGKGGASRAPRPRSPLDRLHVVKLLNEAVDQ